METNKVVAIRKEKRTPGVLPKVQEAIENGDHEACYQALTTKQQMFCVEYLKDLNASRAVKRAGYDTKPGNENRVGSQLLANPGIQFALQGLMASRAEKQALDANFVINKILASIERSENGKNEQAVLRGLEMLGKHLGLFIERQEISGPDGDAIETKRRAEEDAAAFRSSIARLASRSGTQDEDGEFNS